MGSDSCGHIRKVAFFPMPNSKKNWAPFSLGSFSLETAGSKQEAPGGGNSPTRTTPAPQHLPSAGIPHPNHAPGACVCGEYMITWVFCWGLHSSGSMAGTSLLDLLDPARVCNEDTQELSAPLKAICCPLAEITSVAVQTRWAHKLSRGILCGWNLTG